jgi:PAS domain S-box-containing protein
MQLIEDLPTGIMVINSDGKVEEVNGVMCSILSTESNEIRGRLIYDLVDASDLPVILEIVKAKRTRKSTKVPMTWTTPNGSLIHLLGSFSWSGKGERRKLMGAFVETEKGSRNTDIPRRTLEDLPIPVTILNKRLEPVFQNSATDEQISLLSRRKDPVKYPKKDLKGLLMEALTEGKGGMIEVSVPIKDGERIFDVIVTPIYQGRKPEQVMEIWLDVTQPDEGISGSGIPKGVGDELLENSNAIIIGIDMEGHIKMFNSGAKRALGYDPREAVGTIWFDYLVDKDAEKGKLEVFQWNIGSGFRTQYESKVRSASGKTITILLENTIIFDKEGTVSMVLMVGQDVTKTKRLEQTLREQSEKLADTMEELTLYNDLMIHDMYNANAGILGYLELLSMEGIPNEKKDDYMKRAISEVKKSSSIIRDVKVMSQCRPDIVLEPMDLDLTLEKALDRWREIRDGEEDLPVIDWERSDIHIMGDELLEEAIIRILENSFINSRVKDLRIEIEIVRDPSKSNLIPEPVRITIKDNGGGIPDGIRVALLERPTSTEWGSQMLGLYLVKKIISRYNGLVWINNIDEGTEINVILSEAV